MVQTLLTNSNIIVARTKRDPYGSQTSPPSINCMQQEAVCVVCSRRLRLSHSVTRSGYQSVLKMHCSLEDVSIIFNLLKPLKTPIEWGEGLCEVVHCSLEIRVNLNLKIAGATSMCLPTPKIFRNWPTNLILRILKLGLTNV